LLERKSRGARETDGREAFATRDSRRSRRRAARPRKTKQTQQDGETSPFLLLPTSSAPLRTRNPARLHRLRVVQVARARRTGRGGLRRVFEIQGEKVRREERKVEMLVDFLTSPVWSRVLWITRRLRSFGSARRALSTLIPHPERSGVRPRTPRGVYMDGILADRARRGGSDADRKHALVVIFSVSFFFPPSRSPDFFSSLLSLSLSLPLASLDPRPPSLLSSRPSLARSRPETSENQPRHKTHRKPGRTARSRRGSTGCSGSTAPCGRSSRSRSSRG
jgi:hypothetical protein